jgi:L,D-peptidoglycan transpeptidase YkuD (ErfK/YbiS/YcfS/YnhG family)
MWISLKMRVARKVQASAWQKKNTSHSAVGDAGQDVVREKRADDEVDIRL